MRRCLFAFPKEQIRRLLGGPELAREILKKAGKEGQRIGYAYPQSCGT